MHIIAHMIVKAARCFCRLRNSQVWKSCTSTRRCASIRAGPFAALLQTSLDDRISSMPPRFSMEPSNCRFPSWVIFQPRFHVHFESCTYCSDLSDDSSRVPGPGSPGSRSSGSRSRSQRTGKQPPPGRIILQDEAMLMQDLASHWGPWISIWM